MSTPPYTVRNALYADPQTKVMTKVLVVTTAIINEAGEVEDPWGIEAIRRKVEHDYRPQKKIVFVGGLG